MNTYVLSWNDTYDNLFSIRKSQLNNYIGEHSLIPLDLKQIQVRVYHNENGLRLFKEKYWGNKLQIINKQEGFTDFEFYTDDMSNLYQSLFAMTNQVEILQPEDVKSNYVMRVKKILNVYKGWKDLIFEVQ